MWLIHTQKHTLREHAFENVPTYAILSHKWGEPSDELSFVDVQQKDRTGTPGHEKLVQLCRLARRRGLNWVWMDTCCIDKRSSAELSEAINSMWLYYERAAVCFVFLHDVSATRWRDSVWWQRGWTLQELIAPRNLQFCDKSWTVFNNKTALADLISSHTGIPTDTLKGKNALNFWSVAQRMSWAASRITTRKEDRAYSLLGLFSINMPLLYGEGDRAFERLQTEILQRHADESILAWRDNSTRSHGILARSPANFNDCATMTATRADRQDNQKPRRENPPRITSWGIELRADALKLIPKRVIKVRGLKQKFLWAITLTMAHSNNIRELPCTLVLVWTGPAPYCYRRYKVCYEHSDRVQRHLNTEFVLAGTHADMLLYLRF